MAPSSWKCSSEGVWLWDKQEEKVVPASCRRLSCPRCGWKTKKLWIERLGLVPWTHMITVTMVPGEPQVRKKSWEGMRKWFRSVGIETYARVLEVGEKAGMRHYHILVVSSRGKVPVVALRVMVVRQGYGRVCNVKRVYEAGERLGGYLLKYALKSALLTGSKGERRICVSRNVAPLEVVRATMQTAKGLEGRFERYRDQEARMVIEKMRGERDVVDISRS